MLVLGREDVNPDIRDLKGKTALELSAFGGHTKVVVLPSAPTPSFPFPVDIDKVAERPPSLDPSDLPQSPSPSTPPALPSLLEPHPPTPDLSSERLLAPS